MKLNPFLNGTKNGGVDGTCKRMLNLCRFMVMEIYDHTLVETMKYYESGADMPFNFGLVFMNDTCGGTCTTQLIVHWIGSMPEDKWPNFVV